MKDEPAVLHTRTNYGQHESERVFGGFLQVASVCNPVNHLTSKNITLESVLKKKHEFIEETFYFHQFLFYFFYSSIISDNGSFSVPFIRSEARPVHTEHEPALHLLCIYTFYIIYLFLIYLFIYAPRFKIVFFITTQITHLSQFSSLS